MNFLVLVLICSGVVFAGTRNKEILKTDVYQKESNENGLRIAWHPLPTASAGKSSLSHFQMFWKNESDVDYILSKRIPLVTHETSQFVVELTYAQDHIRPCSSYRVLISAVYNDFRTVNSSFEIETSMYSGTFLKKFTCTPTPNNTIDVEIEPSNDFLQNCYITKPWFYVKVKGFSKWNEVREILPEFKTTDTSFALTGLYPYSLYNIEIKEIRTDRLEKASVITQPTVPGPVTDVKLECTSKRSISVGWSPSVEANGLISHYWIEVTDLYKGLMELHRIETQFTKANLQRISPNTAYHFVIWAENEAGNGTTSDTVPVTISC